MRIVKALGYRIVLLSPVLLILLLWQITTSLNSSVFFPTPVTIANRCIELWTSNRPDLFFLGETVYDDILPSVARLLLGWSIGAVAGIALGFVVGSSKLLSDLLNPVLQFLRSIPGPALIPIFIIIFGTGTAMRVTLIAFGSIWPVLINSIEAMKTVDPVTIATSKVLRLPRSARMTRIIFPACLPKVFAGLRVSLSLSVILMVVSELVASTDGIGNKIQSAQMMYMLTDVWCGILLLSLIGFTLNIIFVKVEARVLHWHSGSRGRMA